MTAPTYGLRPVLTSAPAALISVADFKTHAHIDHSDEDPYIEGVVAAATAHLDGYAGALGRALVTQTWKIERTT